MKPRTDLILNAVTYSPTGPPEPRWQCGVGVASKALFHKRLQVTGERFWHRTLWRWRLSDPKVCTQMPIRYEPIGRVRPGPVPTQEGAWPPPAEGGWHTADGASLSALRGW
ncbi:DUF2169 domain-containing protein [Candidatus Thiosymbion oneisti]|uniref:DUF2169 domain-containing protein n=1 Tax=Candidatus Thiosymbion oneisti TaxID=589554 RepID=UPI000B7E888E